MMRCVDVLAVRVRDLVALHVALARELLAADATPVEEKETSEHMNVYEDGGRRENDTQMKIRDIDTDTSSRPRLLRRFCSFEFGHATPTIARFQSIRAPIIVCVCVWRYKIFSSADGRFENIL